MSQWIKPNTRRDLLKPVSIFLPLAAILFATGLWAVMPANMLAALVAEKGPIENWTVAGYFLDLTMLGLLLRKGASTSSLVSLGALLILFAARELDFHKSFAGTSVLRLSYYMNGPFDGIKAIALMAIATFAVCAAHLLFRYGPSIWPRARTGDALSISALMFAATLLISKTMDRLKSVLLVDFGINLNASVSTLIQANEEMLELMLPVLVAVVAWQYLLCLEQPFRD